MYHFLGGPSRIFIGVLALAFSLTACKKDDDAPATPSPEGGSSIPAGNHAVITVDGQTISLVEGGMIAAGSFGQSSSIGDFHEEAQGTVVGNAWTDEPPTIMWMVMKTFTEDPSAEQIEGMFAVQSYGFGRTTVYVAEEDVVEGAVVRYMDADGVEWASDDGTGDQTGSHFEIVSKTPSGGAPYDNYIIRATFNCKVYDGNGNVKTIMNGSVKGPAVILP